MSDDRTRRRLTESELYFELNAAIHAGNSERMMLVDREIRRRDLFLARGLAWLEGSRDESFGPMGKPTMPDELAEVLTYRFAAEDSQQGWIRCEGVAQHFAPHPKLERWFK